MGRNPLAKGAGLRYHESDSVHIASNQNPVTKKLSPPCKNPAPSATNRERKTGKKMENLTTVLRPPLVWTFLKDKAVLHSKGDRVLELSTASATQASFTFAGKDYRIRKEGFWNPKTLVERDGQTLLTFKHAIFGSNGTVEFAGGRQYGMKLRNAPLVTLTFLAADQQEVLRYQLEGCTHPNSVQPKMTVFPNAVPAEDLLLLMVLGCFLFKGFVQESSDLDLLVLVAAAS